MEQIFPLVLIALSLVTATARADVSEHYLPPGSQLPSGQYLPPSNRPPPPVQFPADGSQPPGTFEDPESVVIEADPFARGLNFPGEQRSRGGFRPSTSWGQQSALQRNFNSNPASLNYFPVSSPTYTSLVDNSLAPTSSPDRNYPALRYVTPSLSARPYPVQNQLVQQQLHSSRAPNNGYPSSNSLNNGYPSSNSLINGNPASNTLTNNKQSGYSYERPKIPFSLPRQNYRNSHVTLRQPTTPSDFLVSSLDLSSRSYDDHYNSYHGGTYRNNEQVRNQRGGYSY